MRSEARTKEALSRDESVKEAPSRTAPSKMIPLPSVIIVSFAKARSAPLKFAPCSVVLLRSALWRLAPCQEGGEGAWARTPRETGDPVACAPLGPERSSRWALLERHC